MERGILTELSWQEAPTKDEDLPALGYAAAMLLCVCVRKMCVRGVFARYLCPQGKVEDFEHVCGEGGAAATT
jgi:hypothetical protein